MASTSGQLAGSVTPSALPGRGHGIAAPGDGLDLEGLELSSATLEGEMLRVTLIEGKP